MGWKRVYDDKQVPLPTNVGSRRSGRGGEFRRLLMLTGCQLLRAWGEQKHETILVLSREPLCIEFPTSLSPKGNIARFLPFAFTGKRQMGAHLRSGKAGGGVVMCSIWTTSSSGRGKLIIRDRHLEVMLHTYMASLS